MLQEKTEPKHDDITAQHYLVGFLDVLGQRSILRGIKNLPTNDKEEEDFIEKVKKTYGTVSLLRTAFNVFLQGMRSHTPDINRVPQELQQKYLAARKCEAYTYSFSDSIIIAVPLLNKNDKCTAMNGVYAALQAAAGISTIALANGICLRGGLEVGIAMPIEGEELYGPALERAYYLENNLAEYSRLVVGSELIRYLTWVENQQSQTHFAIIAKSLVKECKKLIIRDSDGRLMIDFLGAPVKDAIGHSFNKDHLKNVKDFITLQYKTYLAKEDDKLTSRFFRLIRYFNYRAKLWDIEPIIV